MSQYDPREHGAKCDVCPLRNKRPVPPESNLSPLEVISGVGIAIVGEAPGQEEEKNGRPFCGPSGSELEMALRTAGIKRSQALITNVILCRPENNDMKAMLDKIRRYNRAEEKKAAEESRPPEYMQNPIECCVPRLENDLAGFQNFITLGGTATRAVTGVTASIMGIRGSMMHLPGGETNRQKDVMPTIHPAFVLRQPRWRHVFRNDLQKAGRWFRGEAEWKPPETIYNPPAEELRQFLYSQACPSFDLETDGIECLTAKIRCVGVGVSTKVMVCGFLGKDGYRKFYPPDEEAKVKQVLTDWLRDPSRPKSSWNGGYYDRIVLESQWGVTVQGNIDGIMIHRNVESELPHGLAYAVSLYAEAPAWKQDREGNKLSTSSESDEQLHEYCALDVALTNKIMPPLSEQLRLRNLVTLWREDQKVQGICADMHTVGMYVDQARRLEEEKRLLKRRHELLIQIRDGIAIKDFNPGSVYQMRDLLFESWGLVPPPDLDKEALTSSGDPSTADIVLRYLLTDGTIPPERRTIIKLIRYYRKVQKILGTYVTKLRYSNVAVDGDLGWDDDEEWIDKETRNKYGTEKMGIVDPKTGRMYPGWNAQVAVTGRLSSSKPINCFDGETEVLTQDGWVKFDSLAEGTPIAQYHKNGTIEFVQPIAYQRKQHDGLMISYESQSSNLFLTPDHRVPLLKNSGLWETVTAEELLTLGAGRRTVHAGYCRRDGQGIPLLDAEIQLLVAAHADASFMASGGLDVGFTKTRKIDRFRSILGSLNPAQYSWRETKTKNGTTRFYLRPTPRLKELMSYIRHNERVWGSWIFELSESQAALFGSELWEWDACLDRQSQYANKLEVNTDWIQAFLCTRGIRANKRCYTNAQGNSVWCVDVRRTVKNAVTHRSVRKAVEWSGTVYCVTVPSDMIVVRREGKVTITHQCQNFPVACRSMVMAAPGHVLVAADMDQVEVRVAASLWGIQKYLLAFQEGKDPHSMTAYMIFRDEFCRAAGIEPKYFEQPGILVGASYDEKGKFKGKGESKELRSLSKNVHFASQYKATTERAHKMIQSTEVDKDDGTTDLPYALMPLRKVREMRDRWLESVPEYEKGWQNEIDAWKRQGYLAEPVLGRRRDFLDGENPNELVNFRIQSAVASLMNQAIIELADQIPRHKWGMGTGIIAQVHDWIGLEVPEQHAEEAAKILESCMNRTHPAIPGVQFTAKADIGKRWNEV